MPNMGGCPEDLPNQALRCKRPRYDACLKVPAMTTHRSDLAEADVNASEVPGGEAEKPTDIPKRGWLQIAKRGWKEAKTDQVPLLAAGLAYYGFMAIFPALLACVLLYGLFADPSQVATQIGNLAKPLPAAAR